jgi:tripartite-type tricarboxylate transporter receptor subunit TctC
MSGICMNMRRLIALALMCCCTPVDGVAQSTDDPYKGKTVNLVIGAGAGGGIDLYGRLVARHIGKHLPGQPKVVAQNMPAAGSIAAAITSTTPRPRMALPSAL